MMTTTTTRGEYSFFGQGFLPYCTTTFEQYYRFTAAAGRGGVGVMHRWKKTELHKWARTKYLGGIAIPNVGPFRQQKHMLMAFPFQKEEGN
jgi:hypothetical protein